MTNQSERKADCSSDMRVMVLLKTRLFVTHGITYLPFVDTIVVLRDGAIVEVGKYDELIDRNGTFADVIRSYLENELDYDESGTDTDGIRLGSGGRTKLKSVKFIERADIS